MPDLTLEKPAPAADAPAPAARPTPDPDPTPADLARTPGRWARVAWYAGTAVLSSVLVFTGLRLDRADLKAPFFYDLDSLLILPLVKATIERGPGGHWRNERMGAPGILELHDFPVIDHLHFVLVWLVGKVVSDVVLAYNLYYLLTYPLAALTGMLAMRHLGMSLPAAAVGGLLYTFQPFHYQRWEEHYFLSAYWLVPLSLLPAFALLKGDAPFFRRRPDGTLRRDRCGWRTAGTVALAAAVASGGAYYAFFTCALVGFAAFYATVVYRAWRPAAGAAGFVAVVVAAGLVNHAPTFAYQAKYGKNPLTDRLPEEVDTYGLKIAHMILPVTDHNLIALNRLKLIYASDRRLSENENRSATLGVVGAAGLVGLFSVLLFPTRAGWPYRPVAALTAFAVLLGVIGGLGAVFNLLVTPQIRAYNRISVFISFLCLFAALWWLDRFLLTRTNRWARRLRYPAWAAVAAVGFLDQTPLSWFRDGIVATLDEQASRFRADARFFAAVERELPPGAKVFCLPFVKYPESPPTHKVPAYDHARGYVHTNTLAWSFGAVHGREVEAWQLDVSFRSPREVLDRVTARGFDGIFVDRRGYPMAEKDEPNKADALMDGFDAAYAAALHWPLGSLRGTGLVGAALDAASAAGRARLPRIVHEDGEQFLVDVRPYRDAYRATRPAAYDALARREAEFPAVVWLGRFEWLDPGRPGEQRYCPPNSDAWVINPADRTRTFAVEMTFAPYAPGVSRFTLSGLADDVFDATRPPGDGDVRKFGVKKSYRVVVPPGRHRLHIHCAPPPNYAPTDYRKFCYSLFGFTLTEVE